MGNKVEIKDTQKLHGDHVTQTPEGSRALIFVSGTCYITIGGYEALLGNLQNPPRRASVRILAESYEHEEHTGHEPGQYVEVTLRFGDRSQKLIDDYVERVQRAVERTAGILSIGAERYDTGWDDDC